jgi:hypothetical protein
MKSLRRTVKETRLDHAVNQDIRQKCRSQRTEEQILKRRDEMDNNTSRMTGDRIFEIVRVYIPRKTQGTLVSFFSFRKRPSACGK